MRKTLLVSLPIVLAFQLGCGSQIETHISWSSCSLIEGKNDGLAECATASLPLDDSGTVPGTIGIFVKRLRAKTQPARGHVWFTEGGPGGAATPIFSHLS